MNYISCQLGKIHAERNNCCSPNTEAKISGDTMSPLHV